MNRPFPLVLGALAMILALTTSACGKKKATDGSAAAAEPESESEAAVTGVEGEPDDARVLDAPPAPAAGALPGSAGLLAEAKRVLDTMTASTYSHKTHVDGTTYDVDCSGFVDYLLARADAPAFAELRAATVKRPLAKHFVELFASPAPKQKWERIVRVQDLAPGDIIAWTKPADVTSTNTGHVMIVAEKAKPRDGDVFTIGIIDSSAAPHGKDDARKSTHATGVGRGTIVLDTDHAGAPIAYRWSTIHSSKRHTTEIAMGRLR